MLCNESADRAAVAAIDELELDERTMIIVTSDNGPTARPRYYSQGIASPGRYR
jgi:hypothetical protein